jgi:inorganic triphosphatase YgiF
MATTRTTVKTGTARTIEVEAKLLAPRADTLEAIAARRSIGRFRLEPRRREALETIYLDTADGGCRRHRIAFRVRRSHAGVEATVKREGRVENGVHERPEWTVPLARWPTFPMTAPARLRGHLAPIDRERFSPLVGTRVERRLFDLRRSRGGPTLAELALDRVELVAWNRGGRERTGGRYAEVEIELRAGDRNDLAAIVSVLRMAFPLRRSRLSKLERALRFAGLVASAKHPRQASRGRRVRRRADRHAARVIAPLRRES